MLKAVFESGEVTVLNYLECITYEKEEFLLHSALLLSHTAQALKGILPSRRGKKRK